MKQEDKILLYKDICSRLPYGIKVKIKYYDGAYKLLAIYTNGTTYATRDVGYPIETYFEDCKPYLFPISSMTAEEEKHFLSLKSGLDYNTNTNTTIYNTSQVDWLDEHYFDYRGLIPMGLAIDATNLNIY